MAGSEQTAIFAPETYRKLSEPFPDKDALNKALGEFSKGLRELRDKCGLADVLVAVKDSYLHEGEEVPAMARLNNGNVANCLPMATWLYAKEEADHKAMIRDMLKMGAEATP